ncbi:MAG: ComEA family DNA-binding protein [Legionellaceae bacterium]
MNASCIAVGVFLMFAVPFSAMSAVTSSPSTLEKKHIEKININTADALSLVHAMKGIGEKRAQAIVDYRTAHGPFKCIDDLSAVKGLGVGFVQKNKQLIAQTFALE